MDTMIEQEVDGSTAASLLENPKPRLTLRDAVRLCGMSEKTLRRKLEAGLLNGFRENLDYGGFMWMIDARSLADLYPDSAQLRDYIRLLEFQLNQRPGPRTASPAGVSPGAETPAGETSRPPQEAVAEIIAQEPPAEEVQESRPAREKPKNNDFVIYLLEENRCLKEDLREKEIRLRQLQDRSMLLERECGEQRGTASTQARVLDWFQRQPQTALPPGPGEVAPLTAPPPDAPTSPAPVRPALLGALAASLMIWLIMAVMHLH